VPVDGQETRAGASRWSSPGHPYEEHARVRRDARLPTRADAWAGSTGADVPAGLEAPPQNALLERELRAQEAADEGERCDEENEECMNACERSRAESRKRK